MQRYFLNENAEVNQRFFVNNEDDQHHIKNVMRLKEDDMIIINFSNGAFKSKIIQIDPLEIQALEYVNVQTELPVQVTIASGMLKNDKYEWMIQKATELGAHAFIPFASSRTIVKLDDKKAKKKIERFEKIIKEAAEQSYRLTIPEINYKMNSQAIYDIIEQYDYVLVAYEETAKAGISEFHQALNDIPNGSSILMVFGPEGGLTKEEVAKFQGKVIGLGPRILRAETAPLYALSAISYYYELMR